MTPIEFVEASLGQTNTSWRRDILWEEKPLAHLIKVTVYVPTASTSIENNGLCNVLFRLEDYIIEAVFEFSVHS